MNKSGFSLVEILVAVAIMGILGALGVGLFNYLTTANVTKTQAKLASVRSAIEFYRASTHQLPTKLEDLLVKPANIKGWTNKYVDDQDELKDAWGNEFVYKVNAKGSAHAYELYSYGKKGEDGTDSDQLSIWELQT